MLNESEKPAVRQQIPVVSLFSGCGGMDLGFEWQGFIPVVAIDNDQIAIDTYNWNRELEVARQGDLSKLSGRSIVDIIEKFAPGVRPRGVIGGSPCQSFSRGNVHRKSKDSGYELPLHYAKILKTLNRKYHLDFFVFENVLGLKSKKHESHFKRILLALEDAGFYVFEHELDASWFKVAQFRRRVFLVGINKELYPRLKFDFPEGDQSTILTVGHAIGELPEPVYFRRSLQRVDIPFHPNHWTMNPRSPKFKDGANNKNGRSFRKLKWTKPSWTVAYGHREIHVHPNGRRRLSIFEAMLLQGFPDTYELLGDFTQQVTQVSNAVPPPLASAIAQSIREIIYDPLREIQSELLKWFNTNRREFPWREARDPYAILVAEKLLQQTSVGDAVINAYSKILALYPTVEALAKARPEDIEPIVAPLGFKYRAVELPKLSQEIVSYHDGKVPDDLNQLMNLRGVGDYTARAVLCFGYGRAVPIVDTNVARFLYRVFGLSGSLPSNPARNQRLIDLASNLIPLRDAKRFNLAMLDLCAKVCVPSNPNCGECPLQRVCDYGQRRIPLEDTI
jgi:DNA (cytosine-5)-methyltransferase 1